MNKHDKATQALINANLLGSQSGKTLNLYIKECEATEKAYEELQRDVKRYFTFDNQDPFQLTQEEDLEWNYLHDKLSKVGKEE